MIEPEPNSKTAATTKSPDPHDISGVSCIATAGIKSNTAVASTTPSKRCCKEIGGIGGAKGPGVNAPGPGATLNRSSSDAYQQQGSMPAQHAAPATQQEAANALTEKADAPMAANAFA